MPIEPPMPMSPQAINNMIGSVVRLSATKPAMKATFPQGKTLRPPNRSMALPILGPRTPERSREKVNAQKNNSVVMPIEAEIGTARIAGM